MAGAVESILENIKSDLNKISSQKDSKIKIVIEQNLKLLEEQFNKEKKEWQEQTINLQEKIIKNSEEYIKKLEGFISRKEKSSYAEIVSTYSTKPNTSMHNQETTYPLMVKSNNKNVNSDKLTDIIKTKINVAKLGIGISGMRRTKNGELLINCQKKEHIHLLKNEVNKLSTDGLNAMEIEKRRPCLIFKGIDENYRKEDFIEDITLQNDYIKMIRDRDNEKHVLTVKGEILIKKFKQKNLIIETTGEMRKILLTKGRVNLGFTRLKVEDCNPLTQCYHCLKFNHTAAKCFQKDANPKCFHCGNDHYAKECTSKDLTPKCSNCAEMNLKYNTNTPVNHSAKSDNCRYKIKMMMFAKQKIDYDC